MKNYAGPLKQGFWGFGGIVMLADSGVENRIPVKVL